MTALDDLRRRVEALEQRRATTEESSAPAPAPAAPPLWREVRGAMQAVPGEFDWVAAQLAVADWLAAREHCGAASALRNEARRAREGA